MVLLKNKETCKILATAADSEELILNQNLVRYSESTIEPTCYPDNAEGIIHSFADRY